MPNFVPDSFGSFGSWIAFGLSLLLAGGGVAAFLTYRKDMRLGRMQHGLDSDDAVVKRWESIVTAQTEALIRPLREELARLQKQIIELDEKVNRWQRLYRLSIEYTRRLRQWILTNHPNVSPEDLPEPPDLIKEEIA